MKTKAIKKAIKKEEKLDKQIAIVEDKINELKNQVASLKALRQGYGILHKNLRDKELKLDEEIINSLEGVEVVGDLLIYLQQHDEERVRLMSNERFAMLIFKSSLYMPLLKQIGC